MAASIHDLHEPSNVKQECVYFLNESLRELGLSRFTDISLSVLKKQNKDAMAEMLLTAMCCLNDLTSSVTDFSNSTGSIKSDLCEAQRTIIKLQGELLACRNEEVQQLKSAVEETVKTSVKQEMRTYSSVVEASVIKSEVSASSIQKVMKTVADEESRAMNVMVFGLKEDPVEDINKAVGDVFSEIKEKPKFVALRVGKTKEGVARPVKVTLRSKHIAEQLLKKAAALRKVEHFKNVYICPDRTLEQRLEQRKLVEERKNRSLAEPSKSFIIKGGKIVVKENNPT